MVSPPWQGRSGERGGGSCLPTHGSTKYKLSCAPGRRKVKGGETSLLFERKREGAPQPKILGVHAKLLTENEREHRELYR